MQKFHRDFLSIIKTALTGAPISVDDNLDYKEIFMLSKKHHIVPLVFQGLYNIKETFEGIDSFKKYTFQLLFHDQNQLHCLKQIEAAFVENNIDYMLLKGSSIKKLYPASEFRLMGDIDILIKESQYEKIKEILPPLGLTERLESDHELIWVNDKRVLVELHKKLIPSYNDDYYSYYYNAWEKASFEDNHCFSMSKEDEYIYIFTHLTKHYRDGGIGLRHLIDIWFFALKNPSLNMDYVNQELEKLELKEFHKNIIDTIDVWFNGKEETELSDYITERIIESGNFGLKEMHEAAHAARASARAESVASAKKKTFLHLVFLPLETMKKKYPILEKLPVLLPIMWVVRWIDAIFNKQNSIEKGAKQLNNIDTQIIDGYNEELKKVGLKFNLKKK